LELAVFCLYSKTCFCHSYCQISTDLDRIILHTHTCCCTEYTCGRLRLRLARGRLQAKPERLFFFCNTCNAHDDGSWRFRQQTAKRGGEDGCYREKVRNFVALAEPDPKYSFLAFLGYPSTILHAHKSLYVTSITKSHSRFGLAWSRRGLSRPTSVFLTTIGVCKILSRSVDIGSTRAKNLF